MSYKVFLLLLSVAALFLALPYPPTWLSTLGGMFTLACLIGAGSWAASRSQLTYLGFTIPERRTTGAALGALVIGLCVGATLLGLLTYVGTTIEPRILERLERDASIPLQTWAVILFHAPILEEITFRLFLLSGCAWGLSRFRALATSSGGASPAALRLANLISGLAFAAIHLPAWYQVGEVPPALFVSIMGLNLLAALAMGEVYVRRGVEAAVLAHLGGDVALHLGGRLL